LAKRSRAFETLRRQCERRRVDAHLAAERGPRCPLELVRVRFAELDPVRHALQLAHRRHARPLEPVGYSDRVDAAVEEALRLLEQRAGEDHNARRAVADFRVLALAELHEELGDLVLDLHPAEDRRTVVRHCDVAVRGDEDLVEPSRAQTCPHDLGDSAGGENVRLDRLDAMRARLAALVADDNERPAVLILGVGCALHRGGSSGRTTSSDESQCGSRAGREIRSGR